MNTGSCELKFEGKETIVACKTMDRRTKKTNQHNDEETEEDKTFRRNQAHMAFTERDVLYICKDCKYTAALVFADVDDDHFYLVQAAVW